MAVGSRVGIDTRTRQRVMRRVALFSYIFIAARQLEHEDAKAITERILSHLEAARIQLRGLWGLLELNRASDMAVLPAMAEPGLRALLAEKVGTAQFESLKTVPFGSWPEEARALAAPAFGSFIQNRIYRQILLSAISERWVEHLTRMEGLRVSIRMEAYAQRDPLVQYKSVSSDAFSELLGEVRMGVIGNMFRVQPARQAAPQAADTPLPARQAQVAGKSSAESAGGKKHKKRRRH
jgi:preprotein translocase subunit SecA